MFWHLKHNFGKDADQGWEHNSSDLQKFQIGDDSTTVESCGSLTLGSEGKGVFGGYTIP